jgi:Fe-S-cluster-containing dehydrogenase component
MKNLFSRRNLLTALGGLAGLVITRPFAKAATDATKGASAARLAPPGYDPFKHKWLICFDIDRCIGCAQCVDACKTENHVSQEPTFFRTWIERYIIKKPKAGSTEARGETVVDSPNGGRDGFPPDLVPREEVLKAFFVPKLCNLCEHSPCTQACPVGATFDAPDGTVLIDPTYCIGCGFCVQACPYGCRFFNHETKTAEKCTLCYHRITRGLKPACVEVCPTQARVFGDLMNEAADNPVRDFIRKNKVQTLKPHLGTDPRVLYANMDKEVR